MASMMTEGPGVSRTMSAADRAASVAPETAIPAVGFFQRGRVIDAVARHANNMPLLLETSTI